MTGGRLDGAQGKVELGQCTQPNPSNASRPPLFTPR